MNDSKFNVGDLIAERKQKSSSVENNNSTEQEKNKSIKQQSNKTINMKKDKYIKLQEEADKSDYVGVNARVLRDYRDHWAVEAKRQRTTVSEVIVEALLKRFGEPED